MNIPYELLTTNEKIELESEKKIVWDKMAVLVEELTRHTLNDNTYLWKRYASPRSACFWLTVHFKKGEISYGNWERLNPPLMTHKFFCHKVEIGYSKEWDIAQLYQALEPWLEISNNLKINPRISSRCPVIKKELYKNHTYSMTGKYCNQLF